MEKWKILLTPCAPLMTFWTRNSDAAIEADLKTATQKNEESLSDLEISIEATSRAIKQQNELYEKATGLEKVRLRRVLTDLLNTKKRYEATYQSKLNQQNNLTLMSTTTETLKDSSQNFTVMKRAQRQLERTTARFDPDSISEMQENMQESMKSASEVMTLLGSPLSTSSTLTVDELNFEAMLEEELGSPVTTETTIMTPPLGHPIPAIRSDPHGVPSSTPAIYVSPSSLAITYPS
jgi:hypothetical protein